MKSYKEYINEGNINEGKDISQDIKKLAQMTDDNDHNGWVVKLAQMLNNKKAEKAMKGMINIHMYFGHMPSELIQVRKQIADTLEKAAIKKLGKKIADEIHMTG